MKRRKNQLYFWLFLRYTAAVPTQLSLIKPKEKKTGTLFHMAKMAPCPVVFLLMVLFIRMVILSQYQEIPATEKAGVY